MLTNKIIEKATEQREKEKSFMNEFYESLYATKGINEKETILLNEWYELTDRLIEIKYINYLKTRCKQ